MLVVIYLFFNKLSTCSIFVIILKSAFKSFLTALFRTFVAGLNLRKKRQNKQTRVSLYFNCCMVFLEEQSKLQAFLNKKIQFNVQGSVSLGPYQQYTRSFN